MGEKRRIMNAGHTHTHTHTHLDVKGFIFSHPLSRDLHPIWTVGGGEGGRQRGRGRKTEEREQKKKLVHMYNTLPNCMTSFLLPLTQ